MARLNLFDLAVRNNPYPHYAELRHNAPLVQVDPGGLWAVSRYRDILALLKKPSLMSSEAFRPMTIQPWIQSNPLAESLVVTDPPTHTRLRGLVDQSFGARSIQRIEPIARDVAAKFATQVREYPENDVCESLAVDLPCAVLCNLFGLDPALSSKFRLWGIHMLSINADTPLDLQPKILSSLAEFKTYCLELIEARRHDPKDDLASMLIQSPTIDGQPLSDDELVSFYTVLIVAGIETTSFLLANSLRILAMYPELLTRLRANLQEIPMFIEEVLRFEPPTHATMRMATEDVEIGGQTLPAGAVTLLLLGSASRDESVYPDPDVFDMDRQQKPNPIIFGHGIHYCLGANLARAEVRMALEEILPQISRIELVGETVWNISLPTRGPASCRMVFSH